MAKPRRALDLQKIRKHVPYGQSVRTHTAGPISASTPVKMASTMLHSSFLGDALKTSTVNIKVRQDGDRIRTNPFAPVFPNEQLEAAQARNGSRTVMRGSVGKGAAGKAKTATKQASKQVTQKGKQAAQQVKSISSKPQTLASKAQTLAGKAQTKASKTLKQAPGPPKGARKTVRYGWFAVVFSSLVLRC